VVGHAGAHARWQAAAGRRPEVTTGLSSGSPKLLWQAMPMPEIVMPAPKQWLMVRHRLAISGTTQTSGPEAKFQLGSI
jgi:hypothetical protein